MVFAIYSPLMKFGFNLVVGMSIAGEGELWENQTPHVVWGVLVGCAEERKKMFFNKFCIWCLRTSNLSISYAFSKKKSSTQNRIPRVEALLFSALSIIQKAVT
jgi:hypothetical protein